MAADSSEFGKTGMRFRVEVTPLGGEHSGSNNFAVAEHWQAAFSDVRELRRESSPEDALSFEALGDDAHRIIDAERNLRYIVEPAQDERAHYASFVLLGARDVEPSEEAPFGYRERAVRLVGEASRERARQVLEALLEVVRAELLDAPFGQVIELGAFVGEDIGMSSPVATLSFKDWRGEMDFWFAGELDRPPAAPPRAAEQQPTASEPPHVAEPPPVVPEASRAPVPAARPLLKVRAPRPAGEPVPSSRRAREDLIGDLFDTMHQLDFAPDIPSGVAFVQNVLETLLPGRVSAVHVFDIDTRTFMLVGVRGISRSFIGQRLSDGDPFFAELMHQKRAQRVEGEVLGASQLRGHFQEDPPARLMAAPVLCEERDLGVIEVGDPEGPEPYSEQEAAALDFIASRFGEFLARRPIVLDAELFGR
jgi:hypothetical protein